MPPASHYPPLNRLGKCPYFHAPHKKRCAGLHHDPKRPAPNSPTIPGECPGLPTIHWKGAPGFSTIPEREPRASPRSQEKCPRRPQAPRRSAPGFPTVRWGRCLELSHSTRSLSHVSPRSMLEVYGYPNASYVSYWKWFDFRRFPAIHIGSVLIPQGVPKAPAIRIEGALIYEGLPRSKLEVLGFSPTDVPEAPRDPLRRCSDFQGLLRSILDGVRISKVSHDAVVVGEIAGTWKPFGWALRAPLARPLICFGAPTIRAHYFKLHFLQETVKKISGHHCGGIAGTVLKNSGHLCGGIAGTTR